MSKEEKASGAQHAEASESGAGDQPQKDSDKEAAPTDFSRNVWILVLVLGAVAAAWLVNRLVSSNPEREAAPVEGPQNKAQNAEPPSYAELAEAQQHIARLSVHSVIGDTSQYLLASPAYKPVGAQGFLPPRLFDVTLTAPGVSPEDLVPLAGVYADQVPVLGQSQSAPLKFTPARDVDFLDPLERVIVVSTGGETRAYPVCILTIHAAVRDELGGVPILVCWSAGTQAARCFVVPSQNVEVNWGYAGRFYRGNTVLYDRATGSLWDTFSGLALTGRQEVTELARLPAIVEPLERCRADSPDAAVLNADMGYVARTASVVAAYLEDPRPMFPVPNYDPETPGAPPAKAFVIGVEAEAHAKAYPLDTLLASGSGSVADEIDGRKILITVTSPRTAHATDAEGQLLDAPVMLWFGWKSVHPDTEVWSPPVD